jgi:hypothetical protein
MPKKRVPKPQKRLTVISRRRAWDAEAFARTLTSYVFYQLEQRAEEKTETKPEHRQ